MSGNDLYSVNYSPINDLNLIFSNQDFEQLPNLLIYINNYNDEISKEIKQLQKENIEKSKTLESENLQVDLSILNICKSANLTELKIDDLIKNIKQLDLCKKNIISSIQFLKKLDVLLNSFNDLNELVHKKKQPDNNRINNSNNRNAINYSQIYDLFSIVFDLISNYFKNYKSINEINLLNNKFNNLKKQISEDIYEDFDNLFENDFYEDDEEEVNPEQYLNYQSACKILQKLGTNYAMKLINSFNDYQLKEFKELFLNLNDEAGSLQNLNTRFVFFKKILKEDSPIFQNYFLNEFKIDYQLALEFCQLNQINLLKLINKYTEKNMKFTNSSSATESNDDANHSDDLLMKNLTMTLNFEKYLNGFFKDYIKDGENDNGVIEDFNGKISSAFNNILKIYLNEQQDLLNEKFLKFYNNKENLNNVFDSSAVLFRFFKNLMNQLIKLTNTDNNNNEILYELIDFFNFNLMKYLNEILKPLIANDVYNINVNLLMKNLCIIINTCDYINLTTSEIIEILQKLINNNNKSIDDVDFPKIETKFASLKKFSILLINDCLNKIISKLDMENDLNFKDMLNFNYKSISGPNYVIEKPSKFLISLIVNLNLSLKNLKFLNKNSYIRNLLDKLIDTLLQKFLNVLIILKLSNSNILIQNLLNLLILKQFFTVLPFRKNYESSDSDSSTEGNFLKDFNEFYNLHVTFNFEEVISNSTRNDIASSTDDNTNANDNTNSDKNTSKKNNRNNLNDSIGDDDISDSTEKINLNFTINKSYLTILNSRFSNLENLISVLMIQDDMNYLIDEYLMLFKDGKFDNFKKILILKNYLTISNEKKLHDLFMSKCQQMKDQLKPCLFIDSFIPMASTPSTNVNSSNPNNFFFSPASTTTGNNNNFSPRFTPGKMITPNLSFFNNEEFTSPIDSLKEFANNSENNVKHFNENIKMNFGKFFNRS